MRDRMDENLYNLRERARESMNERGGVDTKKRCACVWSLRRKEGR